MQLSPTLEFAPVAVVALVVVVGAGFLAAVLYLDHRQTMALIERGQYTDAQEASRTWLLAAGLLLVAVGVGTAIEAFASGDPLTGVTAALVGVAALAYYSLRRRDGTSNGANAEQPGT